MTSRVYPALYIRPFNWSYHSAKRCQDVVGSMLLLMTLAPYFLYIMSRIKLDSSGPVFFRQWRAGLHGKPFLIYKFRTLSHDQCNPTGGHQVSGHDPRLTSVGRKLRANSVDELPQLLNVLLGSMSLVGPRPHAIDHHYHYTDLIPHYDRRLAVLPGLTGLAQISGCRGETPNVQSMRRRFRYDQAYVRHCNLCLDASILWLSLQRRIWRC